MPTKSAPVRSTSTTTLEEHLLNSGWEITIRQLEAIPPYERREIWLGIWRIAQAIEGIAGVEVEITRVRAEALRAADEITPDGGEEA